ncbi:4-(cytidine 5'-diphospho)-2-C-methyl-D-erythritol kinase [Desulfatiglans anilini]|uniref:4-(cytidine 5'-diphospho)-2-C-methyl-D-erythritol kinase n=1 Tax=Desulfatiglans anilini TaxID=90728 RepID=UPI001ABFF0AF|nr:4-(cytidine 5'-diphospho)-2-C-methyl-D-erythritol kinase [Desulfatiglans anilini]
MGGDERERDKTPHECGGNGVHLFAPAKLNLRLKVIGQRPDGYHELVSIMVPVGLFDELDIRLQSAEGIRLVCKGRFALSSGEDNLVYRAAVAFLDAAGLTAGLAIELIKRIPVAAGLGGGSSDAAAVLLGLNRLFHLPFSQGRLLTLARSLGADVPFFIDPKPCIARGIGDLIEPLDAWPQLWYVLVNPGMAVSTAWAFRRLKLELTTGEYAYIVKTLKKRPLELSELLENDLEAVTAAHYPAIGKLKEALRGAGALGALMSGSGPTVFGVFESERQASLAADRLLDEGWPHVFVVRGM